jgi:hypothetical protein
MKIRSYLQAILPTTAVAVSLLVLPFVLTVYFVVSQYSNRFILEQEVTYLDVQNNWLGQIMLNQSWVEYFNRFMDFAFWGFAAFIVLILAWAIGSTKVAFKNHYAAQEFNNFQVNKSTWHGSFFIVLVLKVMLVGIMLYALLAIIGRQAPALSAHISILLQGRVTWVALQPVLLSNAYIFLLQYVIAVSLKSFKHLQAN